MFNYIREKQNIIRLEW